MRSACSKAYSSPRFALPLAAHADPSQPKACAGGNILVAAEHQNRGIDVGSAGITIWEKGAVHVYSHDPKALRTLEVMACLTERERNDLRELMAKAAWNITASTIACQADSAWHTVWSANKHRFDDVLCGRETIDVETRKAFAFVTALETVYAKAAPTPPPTTAPKPPAR